jgi:hypothetical protein
MTELDTPLFIPPEDEGFFVKQDLEEGLLRLSFSTRHRENARVIYSRKPSL